MTEIYGLKNKLFTLLRNSRKKKIIIIKWNVVVFLSNLNAQNQYVERHLHHFCTLSGLSKYANELCGKTVNRAANRN